MKRDESDDETSEHEKSEAKARAPKGNYKACAGQIRNSSITVGPTTIPSICGPISEWLPIPENLPNHPTMAFFGKRRTGKSTTITNIAAACCQHIPFGLVMSDTAYAGYWEQIVPKRHIVQGLRQDVLDWLIDRQKKAVSKYGIEDKRISAFIIFDDVIADQKVIRWSADLARFFVQGRHLAITVFIASQYVKVSIVESWGRCRLSAARKERTRQFPSQSQALCQGCCTTPSPARGWQGRQCERTPLRSPRRRGD